MQAGPALAVDYSRQAMSADPDHIGWLPNTWLSLLASGHAGSLPSGQRFDAAVLLADVAGFTSLTERYAQSGPAGAEQMSELLNRRFGALIAITGRLGGDITHFAGDAIIAIWPASSATALATAAQRAAQCALEIQALPVVDQDAALLPIRAGVSVGSAWWAVLGDADDQAFVVGGQPVLRAGAAAAAGQPGEVIVSAEAWALLQPMAGGSPLAGSDLHRLPQPPPPAARVGRPRQRPDRLPRRAPPTRPNRR